MEIIVIAAVILIIIFIVKSVRKDNSFTDARNGDSGGSFFIDPRDGKKYRTVKIGEQVWMAQNLNYEARGSKCYNNDSSNAKKYGRLYDWETAMKACPEGWHLSTTAEWDALMNYVGGSDIAGAKLKASFGWSDVHTGGSANGSDVYGFAALPGGFWGGRFTCIGYMGYWWSDPSQYGNLRLYDVNYWCICDDGLSYGHYPKDNLYSVRCVQDQGNRTEIPSKEDSL